MQSTPWLTSDLDPANIAFLDNRSFLLAAGAERPGTGPPPASTRARPAAGDHEVLRF